MCRTNRWLLNKFLCAALLGAVACAAHAQTDMPNRVGRLAVIAGTVQVFSEAEPNWRAARINEPITSRNSVSTGPGARAEIRIGATALALGENSQLDVRHLDDARMSAAVSRGTLAVRIAHLESGDTWNIEAGGDASLAARVALEATGRYRIDVPDLGSALVSVFDGRARVAANGSARVVGPSSSLRVSARGASPDMAFSAARLTDLDQWVIAQEQATRPRESLNYVSPNMTGHEDLDRFGHWETDPEHGPVWRPDRVTTGWAPYRYGEWRWVPPWGWTWVDDAPWGFAPFHYGRWFEVRGRWAWWPGPLIARPVYAPALVGFYGGPGISVSMGLGGTRVQPPRAWYPLPPRQLYRPGYERHYVERINRLAPPPAAARIVAERRAAARDAGREGPRDGRHDGRSGGDHAPRPERR